MRNSLYVLLFIFVLSGCSSGSDSMTNEEKIAGKDEKTWKAQKETDASGDKDKLTRDEKRQTITFWRNGNVKMGDGDRSKGMDLLKRAYFAGESEALAGR